MAQQPDPYEHQGFPKMVYFKDGTSRTVKDEDEFADAKAEGGSESPADHGFVETVDKNAEKAAAKKKEAQAAQERADRARAEREAADAKARADAEKAAAKK